MGLPWTDGGLWSYQNLVNQVDHADGEGQSLAVSFVPIARHLLLPLVCITGLALVGLRFSDGVRMGLIRKEVLTLDPALEREAGNIRLSSLHGGRGAAAMRQAELREDTSAKAKTPKSETPKPKEKLPKRLI